MTMVDVQSEYDWLGKNNQLGIDIWKKKYQYENETFNEWLDRISNGDNELRQLILEKKFLFGGRILANRGLQNKNKKITYSNCFVIEPPEDNIESIFDCAKKMARTFSMGGGCGTDISKLAPRGSKLNNAAKETTGAVSFMELYSLVTELISQNGRRGALLLSIDCTHPDLLEFIDIKNDLNKITKANISIKITDDFMNAVKNNENWELRYTRKETNETISKILKAKDLFHKIAENNWNMAEPGFLMWDTINNWNLLSEDDSFEYASCNPCCEEPLPSGGSCLLGSINLSEFIKEPFTSNASFDFVNFSNAINIAITALNDVLDEGMILLPLQEQIESVKNWRQIGCGIFGLADMLIKLGIKYGDSDSLSLCDKIASTMINESLKSSAKLAKEKGCYPKYNKDAVLSSLFFIENTDDDTKEIVEKYGLRNSQLLTCAPTGSLSTMFGISGGIEPIFANFYIRKTESLHNKEIEYKVYTPIIKEYMDKNNIKDDRDLPEYFVSSHNINYKSRIDMQSIWQKYIDASISSTVNLSNSTTVEDIENLYLYAWEKKLKGITVYRDGCNRGGILIDIKTKDKKQENICSDCKNGVRLDTVIPLSRDNFGKTIGTTNKYKTACGSLYVTINRSTDGNIIETFVNVSKNGICRSNIDGISRMVSVALRSGTAVEEIIDQLRGINCAACSRALAKGEKLDGISCPDILAKAIQSEYDSDEIYMKKTKQKNKKKNEKTKEINIYDNLCPSCGIKGIKFEGGCISCSNCGYSKCE